MIVYREWVRHRPDRYQLKHYKGWFLFGVIPLYIKAGELIPW